MKRREQGPFADYGVVGEQDQTLQSGSRQAKQEYGDIAGTSLSQEQASVQFGRQRRKAPRLPASPEQSHAIDPVHVKSVRHGFPESMENPLDKGACFRFPSFCQWRNVPRMKDDLVMGGPAMLRGRPSADAARDLLFRLATGVQQPDFLLLALQLEHEEFVRIPHDSLVAGRAHLRYEPVVAVCI